MLDYEAATGRALLNLGNDMRYVLDHIDKYISPCRIKAVRSAFVWKVAEQGSDSAI